MADPIDPKTEEILEQTSAEEMDMEFGFGHKEEPKSILDTKIPVTPQQEQFGRVTSKGLEVPKQETTADNMFNRPGGSIRTGGSPIPQTEMPLKETTGDR